MFISRFFALFVALLSRYMKKQGVGCDMSIDGEEEPFFVGAGDDTSCTMVFDNRRSFMFLAFYPHLMTFVWLYLTLKVDIEGDGKSATRIVYKLSVKRLPKLMEKLIAKAPFSQQTHYDWCAEAYALFLDDPYMQYTSGRRGREGIYNLEDASVDKLDFIINGLDPQEGERHLDNGCGWGGLIRRFVETRGTISDGITISPEQVAFASKRFSDERARFHHVTDFSAFVPEEPYDVATIVGMLEHVPVKRHAEFFKWLHGRLRPSTRVYLQCITAASQPTDRIRLLKEQVFEFELSTITDILAHAGETGFRVVHIEEGHEDYAFTTWEWVRRILENKEEILHLLDGNVPVFRKLLGYLSLASFAMDEQRSSLHRVFLVKD